MGLWFTYICVSRTREKPGPVKRTAGMCSASPAASRRPPGSCVPRSALGSHSAAPRTLCLHFPRTPRLPCPPLCSGVSFSSAQNALSSPPSDPQAPVSLLFSGVSFSSAQNALSSPPSDPQAPVSLLFSGVSCGSAQNALSSPAAVRSLVGFLSLDSELQFCVPSIAPRERHWEAFFLFPYFHNNYLSEESRWSNSP